MNHKTLDELVREQILAEGPDEFDGSYMTHVPTQERYIDEMLNTLTNVELLERISDAHEEQLRESLDHIKNYL